MLQNIANEIQLPHSKHKWIMERIWFVSFHPKTPLKGWKCPKRIKLGEGSPWKSSDSKMNSKREMDELLVMMLQLTLWKQDKQSGIVDTCKVYCILKETERNTLKTPILECKQDGEWLITTEIYKMLLMASQQYNAVLLIVGFNGIRTRVSFYLQN